MIIFIKKLKKFFYNTYYLIITLILRSVNISQNNGTY